MRFDIDIREKAKPFIKWAGGKTQLLKIFDRFLPLELKSGKIKKYFEPFVGSGALLFYLYNNYQIEEYFISDKNIDLINAYLSIQKDVYKLIEILKKLEKNYYSKNEIGRKKYFYEIRNNYNSKKFLLFKNDNNEDLSYVLAAQFIFLNKTCYNGLYRVNSEGKFNVPYGRYKNPLICDEENLIYVSNVLKNTMIKFGDYSLYESFIDENSFVYFDPPYRPISHTSYFTSYTNNAFNDEEQIRLANFYRKLDMKNAKLMLSNSDPKNYNPYDEFFDQLYRGFNLFRVKANRMINCDSSKRGEINELVIINYNIPNTGVNN